MIRSKPSFPFPAVAATSSSSSRSATVSSSLVEVARRRSSRSATLHRVTSSPVSVDSKSTIIIKNIILILT